MELRIIFYYDSWLVFLFMDTDGDGYPNAVQRNWNTKAIGLLNLAANVESRRLGWWCAAFAFVLLWISSDKKKNNFSAFVLT